MAVTRRLVAIVSLVLVGLLSFAVTTVAFDVRRPSAGSMLGKGGGGGGGNGLPAAGNYHNTSTSASFFTCCAGAGGTTSVSLNVNHNVSVSNPLVGPSTSTDEVDVQFNVSDFTNGFFASGCFIPDGASDFTVNSTLASANLVTTVKPTTRICMNQPINGVTTPFTINATWTVNGPTTSSSRVDRYSCAHYTTETQTKIGGSSNATASFSTSFLNGTISPISGGNVFSFDQFIHAQGTPLDACTPLGGKGAGGPGPVSPGDYTNTSMSASMQVVPDDTTQSPFNIFVTSFTITSHPVGSPISTLSETDLNIFQFNFFQFVQDCWVVPASAVTIASDLHSATLNVSIDLTTPACQFANNTGPSVFAVNATWNSTGPIANFSNTSQGRCGSFHAAGLQDGSGVTAIATGSWPGTAGLFTDTNAFLSTNSTNTHLQGTFTGC